MGNIDSRALFEGGYMYIKTDKEFYQAGQTVFGKVHLRTQELLDAKNIIIRVKGKEKCEFTYKDDESQTCKE